jgi:uncharacterized integral membrane protein
VNRPIRYMTWISLILVLLVGAMFTVQNLDRTSDLSLDLYLVAYHLSDPIPVPYILWAAFGLGLLVAGAWAVFSRMSLHRYIRDLEQQQTRTNLTNPDDDWT